MNSESDPQASSNSHTEPKQSQPLLSLSDVTKYFPVDEGLISRLVGQQSTVKAVDGVDLEVESGETLGIVGESGSGKSTLARTIARLHEPTGGSIQFDGEYLDIYSKGELKSLRQRIQYVFQDPLSALNPRKTAGESVHKALAVHGIGDPNEQWGQVTELFKQVGLTESHLHAYPHELSGGQLQRVGLCRALILEPELLIFDEPVSALDVTLQAQILNLIQQLQSQLDLTYIVISHDLDVVRHICDRIAVMYAGEIVEKGPATAVFQEPQHPYTRALINAIPTLESKDEAETELLDGTPPSATDPPSGCRFHTRCPEFIDGRCVKSSPGLQSVSASGNHKVACHWREEPDTQRKSHVTPSDAERRVIEREANNN